MAVATTHFTKLNLLRSLGRAEIAPREQQEAAERQEVAKRLERIAQVDCPSAPPLEFRQAGRQHFLNFQQAAWAPFFAGADSDAARELLQLRMPGRQHAVRAQADRICAKSFDLLGHRNLFFGDPIDWHFDAVSGHRAPFVYSSRINPLDSASLGGDSRLIREMNRHQWFVTLGQAYRLTGDERYANFFVAQVRAWMQANPRGMGINWSSSCELALRLISWCWALALFRRSKALTATLFVEMLEWLHSHAAHIEQDLSRHVSPNACFAGESLALVYAGLVLPASPDAGRWRARGARSLTAQIEQQPLQDDGHPEPTARDQRYAAEIFLHFLILAQRNGVSVPSIVPERVQGMLDRLLALGDPRGSMAETGFADGGSLLPLTQRATDDCRGLFAVAAACFGRPDYALAARALAPEVAWLLGPEGCQAFDAATASSRASGCSSACSSLPASQSP